MRLGTLNSTSALHLGGHIKQWNHQQKWEKLDPKMTTKGTLFIIWDLKGEGRE